MPANDDGKEDEEKKENDVEDEDVNIGDQSANILIFGC